MNHLILTVVLLVITYFVFKAVKIKNHFKKYGIPHPSEIPFLGMIGLRTLLGEHVSESVKKIYNMNKKAKYVGCYSFSTPLIMITDMELIKSVLVKNFDHFADHREFVSSKVDPLFAKNLFFLNGEKWREVRNLLSPSFTSSKMRSMFTLMSHCAKNFTEQFLHLYKDTDAINMKNVLSRYANDVIATCAFGIEVDSLKNPDNDFFVHGSEVTTLNKGSNMAKFLFLRAFPKLATYLNIRILSKKITNFFINVIQSTIKIRDEQNITRPDMLQLMMDARNKTDSKFNLDILEMTAQAFIFFLGGFDSFSSQMSLIVHELAINPDIREKLQAEIDDMLKNCDGNPSYEDVNNLCYLDAVFNEALRMYPLPFLSRLCSKDFELPPALPGAKPYLMKPGMEIIIPISAIHRDPLFYEDPDTFNPERFLHKRSGKRDGTNLGFGLGPRMCIGNRFAILESKVLLVHLLSKCSLVPCHKTPRTVKYDRSSFIPAAKGGFWLQVKLRD